MTPPPSLSLNRPARRLTSGDHTNGSSWTLPLTWVWPMVEHPCAGLAVPSRGRGERASGEVMIIINSLLSPACSGVI